MEPPSDLPKITIPGITLRAEPLSRGPLTVLYRGWDRVHRCDIVAKVQRATDDPVAMNRFGREAAVMLRLRHPGIVALYAFQEAVPGDRPAALIMEYVPGQTLAALVAAEGALSPEHAARIIEEIAAALDCVHAIGIVHRDVKPSNILLPRRGSAKLTDFGVARIDDDAPLTVMGDILGTIEYASPEQVHGNGAVDTRSDVYSLAAVSYFALTGTPPFRAADSSTQAQLSVMHRQVFADPPSLRLYREDLSPAIEAAVLRGLAKAPDGRYASAGQLAAALRAAVSSAEEPQQSAVEASARRTGVLAGSLASAVLLLAAFALWKSGGLTPPVSVAHVPVAVVSRAHVPVAAARKPALPKPAAGPRPAPHMVAAVPTAPKPRTPKPVTPNSPAQKPLTVALSAKPVHKAAPIHKAPQTAQAPKAQPHKPLSAAARKPLITSRKPLVTSHKPVLVAARPSAQIAKPLPPVTAAKKGWLLIYANQNTARLGQPSKMAAIPAQTITIDGKAVPVSSARQWISVPAGRHLVSFYPSKQSGFSPRTGIPITVAPGAHARQQVLLALAIGTPPKSALSSANPMANKVGWYTVSGWIAAEGQTTAPKTPLIRASALWIKVDGQPLPALALGQWAELPAGKHWITFQPTPGLGGGPKTWAIDLAPQAHLSQQVPLPPAPLPAIPPHLRNP